MTLTAENLATLEVIIRIGASLTIIGSSAILYDVYRNWATIRKTPNRMTIYWCVAALIPAPALLIGRSQLPPTPISPPNGTCMFQALAISIGFLGSSIWAAAMATNVWLVSAKAWPLKQILKMGRFYHIVAWGVPSLVAIVPLALTGEPGREGFYGNATLWCWISNSYAPYRLILFFGPLWFVFALCIGVYAHTGLVIRASFKDTLSAVNSDTARKKARGQIRVRLWFAIRCGLFLMAFFTSYIGGTINRIANFFLASPSYPLFLFHVLTIPSAGMFNAMGYFGATLLTRLMRKSRKQTDHSSKAKTASVKGKRNTSSAHALLRSGQINATLPTSTRTTSSESHGPSAAAAGAMGLPNNERAKVARSGSFYRGESSSMSQAGGAGVGTGIGAALYESELDLGSWGGLDVPSGFLFDELAESSSRMDQAGQSSRQQESESKPVK